MGSRHRTRLTTCRSPGASCLRALPEAEQERAALPKTERAALINADAKLGAYGPLLG